ncbi:unnamed protein product [Symbiodinium natans]|uniref:PNPLA domain-containing protein n=1 Tax=Symbiodinium natans TaxID=878477 RepID=A0A812K232_9DINO|nr:unnamed protein product [Symbiodinium natans]
MSTEMIQASTLLSQQHGRLFSAAAKFAFGILVLVPLVLLELLAYGLLFFILTLAISVLAWWQPQPAASGEKVKMMKVAAPRSLSGRLRAARAAGDSRRMAAVLREALTPDLCGILHEDADAAEAEELTEEVCKTLQTISCSSTSLQAVKAMHASFGQSCLYLSGGGMLGMYHIGTVRQLLDDGLLPDHLCGTSVGSIVGAFVATRTDQELREELNTLEEWYRQMGPEEGPFPVPYWEVVVRVLWRGYIYDYMNQYRNQASFVSMGLTFAEAFERTGRTFTITCTPTCGGPLLLLNRHTAPNVLIASAVCASSSMPMLVQAVRLLEKAPDGTARPWPGVTALVRDGTMMADSPCHELAAMLNTRWSIVSQVNPHVVPLSMPFLLANRLRRCCSSAWARVGDAEPSLRRCIWTTLRMFQSWTGLPRQGGWIYNLLFQDYFGDVNIVHDEMRFMDYVRVIKNEISMDDFQKKAFLGAETSIRPLQRHKLRAKVEAALRAAHAASAAAPVTSSPRRQRRALGRRTRM